jgi:hypothetical protein
MVIKTALFKIYYIVFSCVLKKCFFNFQHPRERSLAHHPVERDAEPASGLVHQPDELAREPEEFAVDDVIVVARIPDFKEKHFIHLVRRQPAQRIAARNDATPADATASLVRLEIIYFLLFTPSQNVYQSLKLDLSKPRIHF